MIYGDRDKWSEMEKHLLKTAFDLMRDIPAAEKWKNKRFLFCLFFFSFSFSFFFLLHRRNGRTDGRLGGPTDGQTDGQMDRPSYRDAMTHLKNIHVVG